MVKLSDTWCGMEMNWGAPGFHDWSHALVGEAPTDTFGYRSGHAVSSRPYSSESIHTVLLARSDPLAFRLGGVPTTPIVMEMLTDDDIDRLSSSAQTR